MYMQPFNCKVVGQTGSRAVAPAVPPDWCEDDQRKCVPGPKQVRGDRLRVSVKSTKSNVFIFQMVYWNQLEGNNVVVSGTDRSGRTRAPAYNGKMGFANGELVLPRVPRRI